MDWVFNANINYFIFYVNKLINVELNSKILKKLLLVLVTDWDVLKLKSLI